MDEEKAKQLTSEFQHAIEHVLTDHALTARGPVLVEFIRRWDRATGVLVLRVEVDG